MPTPPPPAPGQKNQRPAALANKSTHSVRRGAGQCARRASQHILEIFAWCRAGLVMIVL